MGAAAPIPHLFLPLDFTGKNQEQDSDLLHFPITHPPCVQWCRAVIDPEQYEGKINYCKRNGEYPYLQACFSGLPG